MSPQFPSGTVTFLFTDIEGSTRLLLDHPGQMKINLARHDAILGEAVESHRGYVFKTIGDAFCAAFATGGEALQAAIAAQSRLCAQDWGNAPIKVRMGIHTGNAEIQENGDYSGYASLSRVQRLMSAGHGGQILLSRATQDLVRDELPQGVSLHDLGEHRLKDLIHPEHIYQVLIPALPCDFPALKTLNMLLNNLPVQLTPFIGREREETAVLGLMRNPGVRLVTLTGAGGTGKTRLSLQVAADLLDEYEDGVWFVDLASISDPELIIPTIAATLKIKASAGTPLVQSLQEYLSNRQLLLILDNFEQVVSAAPGIGTLLSAAPKVKVLVSSRAVLRLRGEHDYPVPPLGLPESRRRQSVAVLAQYEAIALFIQHAHAANPAFVLDEGNASSVTEICIKLDGLPLAIELAAARSRLLSPAAMLERLKSRLNMLTGGARDLPRRQQTMRAAIDWSYELLDEAEKVLFARLGIFVGGWSVAAAETVCGAGLAVDVLSGMESLLDKSLIRQVDGVQGEMRFNMLETIREYACEKLAQGGELSAIQQAHVEYMDAFLEKGIRALSGPDEVTWFSKLDLELDNLRTAVDWALKNNQPALVFKAGRLYQYWAQRVHLLEPLGWLERSLTMATGVAQADRSRAMLAAGNLLVDIGKDRQARSYYESALQLFREAGDQDGTVRCLNNLGNIAWHERNYEKARQLYEQSLQAGQVPDSFGLSMTLNNLGSLARIRGDYQEAHDYFMQSREICLRLGAEAGVSFADGFLGILALAQRNLDEARTYFKNGLQAGWVQANQMAFRIYNGYLVYIQLLLGDRKEAHRLLNESLEAANEYMAQSSDLSDFWFIMEGKARLELMDGRVERAAQLLGAAWNQRERDYPLTEAERPDYEAIITAARSALGGPAFDEAFAKGYAMTVEQAIAFALEQTSQEQ